MRIEKSRVIIRREIDKGIVEDNDKGLFLTDSSLNVINNLGFENYRLLDYAPNGNIILLISKEWLTIRNTNKTTLTAFDISKNEQLFTTNNFLAYRSIIDKTSNYFLLEYYSGLCSININNGEVVFRKDKIDKYLFNADLHLDNNIVIIPTNRKSLLTFDFNEHILKEIKLEKISGSAWVKFNKKQTHLLVSDNKNFLHCFDYNSLIRPIWSINFSKFKTDNRIRYYRILITENNLGCVQGFIPAYDQNAYAGGTLYIFDIETGEIVDRYDYANIREKIITDFKTDEIIIDNLTTLSLTNKTIKKTPIFELLR